MQSPNHWWDAEQSFLYVYHSHWCGWSLFGNNRHHILIRYYVAQSYPLRYVSCAGPPHHRVLERLLQRSMDLITNIFNRRVISHYQRFAEIRVFALPVQS